jgi:hypothetical protein
MMILALGIGIAESDFMIDLLGKERSTSYWVGCLIRILCMMISSGVSASDLGFVNLLNLTGSLLGATLTFIFPVKLRHY